MMAQPTCASCNQPCQQRFQITRYDAANTPQATVDTCGLVCLVKWAYTYGTSQGMRFAVGLQAKLHELLSGIKG